MAQCLHRSINKNLQSPWTRCVEATADGQNAKVSLLCLLFKAQGQGPHLSSLSKSGVRGPTGDRGSGAEPHSQAGMGTLEEGKGEGP